MSKFSQELLSVFIAVLWCLHFHHYAEAQTTTVRPYKFGFTIDEQQHRYESRDERGIVMGEFGFITADGIYHVTVYATDEEGRFRILAMKSYPYESRPTTFEIMMKPKKAPTAAITTTTTTTTTVKPTLPRQKFYNEACSGCFLSNGKDNAADKTGIQTLSKPLPSAGANPAKSPNFSNNLGAKSKSGFGSGTAGKQPGNSNGVASGAALHTSQLLHFNEHQHNSQPLGSTQSISQHTQAHTSGHTRTQLHLPTSQTTTTLYRTTATNPIGAQQYARPQGGTNAQRIFTMPGYKQTPVLAQNPKQNNGFTHPATSLFTTNPYQSKTAANIGVGSVPGYKQFPDQQQTATNALNIGLVQQQTPSKYFPNTYTQKTIGNNGFPNTHTQAQTHSSNGQDSQNSANAPTQRPVMQPNVMDVIVNKVLPSVMGLNGVVAKPTTMGAPSGRSPLNSVTQNGKSGSINPAYAGKTNNNPQYKPNIGGSGKGPAAGGTAGGRAAAGAAGGAVSASAAGGDGDLYRFKYILDYHGHTETGKRNGNKEGNYFAIGDDDIERTIEYVANENGYQPRIHWRKLSNPVPSKENTLKDYEFVWFTLK